MSSRNTGVASASVTFRVFTLEKALAYLRGRPEMPAPEPARRRRLRSSPEHWTVNAFVVESTTALAQATAALRRHGEPEVAGLPSTARMLAFLKRAQAAVHCGHEPSD